MSYSHTSSKHQQSLSFLYILFSIGILSFYGTRVCPFIDSLPATTVLVVFLAGFSGALVFKAIIEPYFVDHAPAMQQPIRQLVLDMGIYMLAGSVITYIDIVVFNFPAESGYKVIVGCLTFGVFASLDNALLRERENFHAHESQNHSGKIFPITRRIFFAFAVVVVLTGAILGLVVLKDINYIIDNIAREGADILKRAVFIDISFVIGLVLLLSFRLMKSYSVNLNSLFSMQIDALSEVETGEFNTRIPVVTTDEFSLIAKKTNSMIRGLSKAREEEKHLFDMTLAISSEIHLKPLLLKIMGVAKIFLDADRCTLFLHDNKSNELWSVVAQGLDATEIRIPDSYGIAGHVYHHGDTLNITDAYSDKRFNQSVDKDTGYKTNTIICMPVVDKEGNRIGIIQALNKTNGTFTESDESRLKTFSAQAAIALVNAQLFDDVNNMRIYNESVLKSLSNGVITLDDDGHIAKANEAALNTLQMSESIIGEKASKIFINENTWVIDSILKVAEGGKSITSLDSDLHLNDDSTASINLNVVPLCDLNNNHIGSMLVLDDITNEKRVRNTMSRYFTEEVADQLLLEGTGVLGGASQEVSVLFSDIRGFTTLSEKLGPRDTVSMLNDYFSVMVDEITLQNGILDKYIGDAIMAIFGAPFSSDRDADNSVNAAIQMMKKLSLFNAKRLEKGFHKIDIGVGISSGDVILGNIGSEKRMDYTVIGDTVNLASRLEGANKHYGTKILINEATNDALQDNYQVREIDRLRVKGKSEPAVIFEILDYHDDNSFPNRDDCLDLYAHGIQAYQQRNWTDALDFFQQAITANSNDSVSKMYIKRCTHFLAHSPKSDWDGVWTMTEK